MELRLVAPRHSFGFHSACHGALHYLDDVRLAFPVGRSLVFHNIQSNTQRFIHSPMTGTGATGGPTSLPSPDENIVDSANDTTGEGNAHMIKSTTLLGASGSVPSGDTSANTTGSRISAMCISTNRRFIAVAHDGDSPSIEIYDTNNTTLTTNNNTTATGSEGASGTGNLSRRRKLLNFPDLGSNRYVCMEFSSDGRYLVTQGGNPEWTLVFWNWERARPLARLSLHQSNLFSNVSTIPVVSGNNTIIRGCTVDPADGQRICVYGLGMLRHLRFLDGALKPAGGGYVSDGLPATEEDSETVRDRNGMGRSHVEGSMPFHDIHCALWLPGNYMVAGTENGELVLFCEGGYSGVLSTSPHNQQAILVLLGTTNGFVCGGAEGLIHIFQATTSSFVNNGLIDTLHSPSSTKKTRSEPYILVRTLCVNALQLKESMVNSVSKAASGPMSTQSLSQLGSPQFAAASFSEKIPAVQDLTGNRRFSHRNSENRGPLSAFAETSEDGENAVRKKRDTGIHFSEDIIAMTLSPLEDFIAIGTSTHQIYAMAVPSQWTNVNEIPTMLPIVEAFHNGPILGLDTCVRKPMVVTSGRDCTIRIWNTHTHHLEICKRFQSEAFSVALHPSGLHLLAGFQDRLRLMNIYGDDIREFKAFHLRQCMECRFSVGGQYFAAVNVNTIVVYGTYTCSGAPLATLRGPTQRVKSIYWTGTTPVPSDTRLLTCGMDGSVYDWNMKEFRKEAEATDKKSTYHACVADDKTVWVVGTHTQENRKPVHIREIDLHSLHGEHTMNEYECADPAPTCLALSTSHRMLIGGCEDGCVRVYALPIQGGMSESIVAHVGPINRIALTYDESTLYTVGEDGVLMIYDVKERGTRTSARREIPFSEETLITRTELDDKVALIQALKQKIEEQRVDMDFHDRRRNNKHEQKIREISNVFRVDALKQQQQFEKLWNEHVEQERRFADTKRDILERHKSDCQRADQEYLGHLGELEQTISSLRTQIEQTRSTQEQERDRTVREWNQRFSEEEESILEKLSEEQEHTRLYQKRWSDTVAEQKETRSQLELDTDAEIEDMKRTNNAKVETKRAEYLRLKGENGITRNKFITLQKDIDEKTVEAAGLEATMKRLGDEIVLYQNRAAGLREEIHQRDDMIGEREHQIYELKKQNQELEKYKFVLDHKIRVLKSQIDPKAKQIAEAKLEIKRMDAELEQFHHNNEELTATITMIRDEIERHQQEIQALKNGLKDNETYRNRVRTDLCELAALVQDPDALRSAVDRLYRKYVPAMEHAASSELPQHLREEYTRQKIFLERSVDVLRRTLTQNNGAYRSKMARGMSENMQLIEEIAGMRREIKELKQLSSSGGPPIPHMPGTAMNATNTAPRRRNDSVQKKGKPFAAQSLNDDTARSNRSTATSSTTTTTSASHRRSKRFANTKHDKASVSQQHSLDGTEADRVEDGHYDQDVHFRWIQQELENNRNEIERLQNVINDMECAWNNLRYGRTSQGYTSGKTDSHLFTQSQHNLDSSPVPPGKEDGMPSSHQMDPM